MKKSKKAALNAHDQALYDRIFKVIKQDDKTYILKNYSSAEMVEVAIFKGGQEAGIGFDRNKNAKQVGVATPIYRVELKRGREEEHFSHILEAELDSRSPDFEKLLTQTLRRQIAEAQRSRK